MEESELNVNDENLQTETTTVVESNSLENAVDGKEITSQPTRADESDNEPHSCVHDEDNDVQSE